MLEIHQSQAIALAMGFQKVRLSGDGTILWLSRGDENAEEGQVRMCIDAITQSITVFWIGRDKKIVSKTFRKAREMQAWLAPSSRDRMASDHL